MRECPEFSESGQDAPPFRNNPSAGSGARCWPGALGSRTRGRQGRGKKRGKKNKQERKFSRQTEELGPE